MQMYIGINVINAVPMSRQDYNTYRGWELPDDEIGEDAGYLVEYTGGGVSNHPSHAGYISWSLKAVFEAAYKASGTLCFGAALLALRQGASLRRTGWNGVGLWIDYVARLDNAYLPYLQMSYPVGSAAYPNGARVPWLASQTDMLASDWCIV